MEIQKIFGEEFFRFFEDFNGELWFIGKDVAEILEYQNTKQAIIKKIHDIEKENFDDVERRLICCIMEGPMCRKEEQLTISELAEILDKNEKAIRNASPIVEVKARRVGGSTYQVPIEVSGFRATNLSLRWIIRYSKQRCIYPLLCIDESDSVPMKLKLRWVMSPR